MLWGSPKTEARAELAQAALCSACPCPGASVPGHGGPAGSGQQVLPLRDRLSAPDGRLRKSLAPAGPEEVGNCDFLSFHSMH